MPKEVRDQAAPLLATYGWLLPSWAKLLAIGYSSEMMESYAEVSSEPSQHRVTLTFGGGWLDCDGTEREWVVVHELVHTRLASLERAWDQMATALPKKMQPVAEKIFEDALEEAVSGLAYALVKEVDG